MTDPDSRVSPCRSTSSSVFARSRTSNARRLPAPSARSPRPAPRWCSAPATPHADLLFVGEGPGEQEDLQGDPVRGPGREAAHQPDRGASASTRDAVYIANVVKCRPPGQPRPAAARDRELPPLPRGPGRVHRPQGRRDARQLRDQAAASTPRRASPSCAGSEFPYPRGGVLVPTLHPSAVLRNGGTALAQARADFVVAKRALAQRRVVTGRHGHPLGRARPRRSRSASARCCAPATSSCSQASSAPARPCSPRASPVALGITEPVVSPTLHHRARSTTGSLPLVHVDVYRIDHLQELHDLGFDELVGDDAVTLVEWGDRVSALLPADRLEVTIGADADDDDTRRVRARGRRPVRGAPRRDALAAAVDAGAGSKRCRDVLVLGIDTATARVSVAVGDARHCARRGAASRAGAGTPSSSPRRCSTCAVSSSVELDHVAAIAVGHRARPVHRAAGRGDHGQGDGPGAAHPRGRRARASISSPTRCATATGCWSIGARRPPPRGVPRAVPARARRGAAGLGVRGAARPPTWSPTFERHRRRGAARGRRRRPLRGRVRRARPRRARRPRVRRGPARPRWCELAAARVQREEFEPPWDVHPMYLRQSDAEIEWDRRADLVRPR